MTAVDAIMSSAQELSRTRKDYDALLEWIGDARFVLLGEATHGTQEFYQERAEITKRLICERGFCAVAVEADWPDAYRANRYVCNQSDHLNADQALSGFKRFPAWMWRNEVVAEFIEWLKDHNRSLPGHYPPAGFYGLDLYSLFTSIDEVLQYLDATDPLAAHYARSHYACFDHYNRDAQRYGYAVGVGGMSPTCEVAVLEQLKAMNRLAVQLLPHDSSDADALFYARQNARLAVNAEEYYRTMFNRRISSWNLRDQHMADTLKNLAGHLSEKKASPAKIVVWAHNSHIGDARATETALRGEFNLGQLMRQSFGEQAFLVGLTTNHGTVLAASAWDEPPRRKQVLPALPGSVEQLFRQTGIPRFMLPLREINSASIELSGDFLQRAIGVIYLPETERQSHYLYAKPANQFDAILHIDETCAIRPLDLGPQLTSGEAPETFPVGI